MQMNLSLIIDETAPVQVKILHRCRSCRFYYKHEYGNMHYCRKRIQRNTAYGHKKVKGNSVSCWLYEKNY